MNDRMLLVLMAGQSNMAGRGVAGPDDLVAIPGVLAFRPDGGWIPAIEPVTRDRSFVGTFDADGKKLVSPDPWDNILPPAGGRVVGVGCGRTFGGLLREAFPDRTVGLIPAAVGELAVTPGWEKFICPDFETIGAKRGLLFTDEASGLMGKAMARVIKIAVQPRPRVKGEDCIGCGECARVCPAKAITMVDKKPSIDYKTCIRCFCCQEFCPIGAMKVRRTAFSRIMEKIR